MIRFVLGMFVGGSVLLSVAYLWSRGDGGCLGRCGEGTHCDAHRCIVSVVLPSVPAPAPAAHRKHRRGAGDSLRAAAAEAQLHPGDEKAVAQGDALGRPERIDLTRTGDAVRDITQDDLDRAFRPSEAAILRCITDALGDAPLETGHIEVGMRIERGGDVSRVRVEAPALLQRNGLTRCVRPVVMAARFPASGGASVVTYPFELK